MNFRKCCLAQENECWFKTKPHTHTKTFDSCSQKQQQQQQNKEGKTRKEKSVGSVGENTDMCTLRGKNDSTLLFCFTNFHKKNSLAATSSHVCLFLIRTTFSTLMKTRSRVKVANTAAPFPRTSGPSWPHPPLHLQSCPRALIRVRIQG